MLIILYVFFSFIIKLIESQSFICNFFLSTYIVEFFFFYTYKFRFSINFYTLCTISLCLVLHRLIGNAFLFHIKCFFYYHILLLCYLIPLDPEGMSFNDLKPLYKEFLLKLAATLTQDELYQRSASIMRRRRRPQRRRSSRRTCLLGRAIKRSVSRLKGGPTEFTSVIFPARRLNDSFGSSSSCDARNNHRNRVLANKLGKRRSSWRTSKNGACHTTSEDSDTCKYCNIFQHRLDISNFLISDIKMIQNRCIRRCKTF